MCAMYKESLIELCSKIEVELWINSSMQFVITLSANVTCSVQVKFVLYTVYETGHVQIDNGQEKKLPYLWHVVHTMRKKWGELS